MTELCAVVGIGQTHHKKVRDDVSMAGLVREAAERALEDAEMRWADIDAIVMRTAPDMFDGLVQPELYMADALGAAGKPIMRVHTAGSVGGSTAVVAAHHIQAGVHERVLTLGWEKQSEGDTSKALSGGRKGGVGAGIIPSGAPAVTHSDERPVAGAPRGAVSHALLVPCGQASWLKVTSRTSMWSFVTFRTVKSSAIVRGPS